MILHTGDCFNIRVEGRKHEYVYCGNVEGKRLLFGNLFPLNSEYFLVTNEFLEPYKGSLTIKSNEITCARELKENYMSLKKSRTIVCGEVFRVVLDNGKESPQIEYLGWVHGKMLFIIMPESERKQKKYVLIDKNEIDNKPMRRVGYNRYWRRLRERYLEGVRK